MIDDDNMKPERALGFWNKFLVVARFLFRNPPDWADADLRSFLELLEAWASDSENPANPNPWRHAADVVRAGLIYE